MDMSNLLYEHDFSSSSRLVSARGIMTRTDSAIFANWWSLPWAK